MKFFRSQKTGQRAEYLDLVRYMYSLICRHDYTQIGIRRLLSDVRWRVNSMFTDPVDLDMFDYKPVKLQLLKKIYEDEDMLEEAAGKFRRDLGRKISSVSLSFVTRNKPARLKSACMTAATLFLIRKKFEVDIFYRTTEVPKKFGADLIFLRYIFEKYFEEFVPEISRVTFHFMTIYSAVTYYPLIYTWGIRVPPNSDFGFHKSCLHQLDRADELDYTPGYSQTARAYETYRRWKYGKAYKGGVLRSGTRSRQKKGDL